LIGRQREVAEINQLLRDPHCRLLTLVGPGGIGKTRAAWEWAVTHGEFALIEQTMRVFSMLYDTRGWLQEGLDLLGRAIDVLEAAHGQSPPDRTNQVALGHMLASRSVLATRLGRHEQAQAMLERSLDILRPLNEPRVLVEAITFLGLVMEFTGNYARAAELYAEGLEIATAVGDRWFAALYITRETQGTFVALDALVDIATLKAKQGHIEQALELSSIVLNHPGSLQETKSRADRLRPELEAQLTSRQAEAAQTRAKAKTFEAAVEELLQVDG
jgi:tetratricopeptide (TPR) repeat protein